MHLHKLLSILSVAAFVVACGGGNEPLPVTHEYHALGQPDAEVSASPQAEPSLVIMGGGPDVDNAFAWMIARAGVRPGTGGRFVVIRATGTDAYNPYIYFSDDKDSTSSQIAADWVGGASMGLSSVETLVIPDRNAANHPFVNAVVARAQAVFIAGGDQSDYIRYWKGTALHATLDNLIAQNVPVGGTSAGLAVLGQFDFSAMVDSVSTAEALTNPYNEFMTLDPDPLSLTGGFLTPAAFRNTILDSHLDSRDRMGRLMTFVSRLVAPLGSAGCKGGILAAGTSTLQGARGIGVGVETALLVQGDGLITPFTGQRVTNPNSTTESAVYFVRPMEVPKVCSSGLPLTVGQMEVRKLSDSSVFNLSDWAGKPARYVDVTAGVLSSSPY
ncbi:MAG: cyanophycinase [Betaproteobacteria bacterium]|nr:cyanophycinase [Betaproteobacteria bacterium]